MASIVFFKGLIVGFAMAVPIGPAGILCVRKTLAEGRSRGLTIGLGAATADLLLASVAAFGLTFISDLVSSQHLWLRMAGGGAFLVLGIRTFRIKRKDPGVPFGSMGVLRSYLSAFLIAVTNPMTIFGFVAVFAVVGLGHTLVFISASILVAGVFTGSCLWFLMLANVATVFRKRLNADGLTWVNRVAGILIMISGIAAFVSLL